VSVAGSPAGTRGLRQLQRRRLPVLADNDDSDSRLRRDGQMAALGGRCRVLTPPEATAGQSNAAVVRSCVDRQQRLARRLRPACGCRDLSSHPSQFFKGCAADVVLSTLPRLQTRPQCRNASCNNNLLHTATLRHGVQRLSVRPSWRAVYERRVAETITSDKRTNACCHTWPRLPHLYLRPAALTVAKIN
jgi:hypothetical protein